MSNIKKELKMLMKENAWTIDWKTKTVIIYDDDQIYFLPMNVNMGIVLDTSDMPLSMKKIIFNQIIIKNTIQTFKTPYKSKVNTNIIRKFPILNYILMYTLKMTKHPIDLDDKITIFKYDDKSDMFLNIKDKLRLIIQSTK